jgi:hypothetical protein
MDTDKLSVGVAGFVMMEAWFVKEKKKRVKGVVFWKEKKEEE